MNPLRIQRSEHGLYFVWEEVDTGGRPAADGSRSRRWVITQVCASHAQATRWVKSHT